MASQTEETNVPHQGVDADSVPANIIQSIAQRFGETLNEWRLRMRTFILLGDEIYRQERAAEADLDRTTASHSNAILTILDVLRRFESLPSPLDPGLPEAGLRSRISELEIDAEKLSAIIPEVSEAFWDWHQMIEDLVYNYRSGAHLMCTQLRARLYIPNEKRFVLPPRRGVDPKVELAGSEDSVALGDLADHIRGLESRSADDQNMLHIIYTIMEFWLASPWPEHFVPATEDDTDTPDLWLYNAENAFYAIRNLHTHIPADSTTAYPEYTTALDRYLETAPKRFAAYRRHLGLPQFVPEASPAEYTFDIDEVSIPVVDPEGRMDSEINTLLASVEMQRLALETPEDPGASTPDDLFLRINMLSDLRHGLQLRQRLEREPRWRHPELLLAFTDICEDIEKYGDEVLNARDEEPLCEILDIWQDWSQRVLAILGFRDVLELSKMARHDSPIPKISVTPAVESGQKDVCNAKKLCLDLATIYP